MPPSDATASSRKARVMITFGTRPEAIKMAPVIRAFENAPGLELKLCVTAQHRKMLDQVLKVFELRPQIDLDLMRPGQDLTGVTCSVLKAMEPVLSDWRPDLMLVHGDTTTTFAASLAAFYQQVPVGHVEAGLRTGNLLAPWPEEANRSLTARLAGLHFAPTPRARQNLLAEGVNPESIHLTGNTVVDALHWMRGQLASPQVRDKAEAELDESAPGLLNQLDSAGHVVLVTGHRRENFGGGFERICRALRDLAQAPDIHLVYPVHLNPNVQEPVMRILKKCPRVHLIPPLSYLPFVYLMEKSRLVISDSGGIQEEAPSLGKPVLVMRKASERPEAIEAGVARLVGTDREAIVENALELLRDERAYGRMQGSRNPFGDGNAAEKILSHCLDWLASRRRQA
jgi:UDP-N-acetylglucosamine 2-epimerase (non-hydrolysing)